MHEIIRTCIAADGIRATIVVAVGVAMSAVVIMAHDS